MKRWFAAGLVPTVAVCAWVAPGPATAQIRNPAISCAVSDHNLNLDLFVPLALDGSGVIAGGGPQGSLEINHYKIAKERRRWSLDGRAPTQMWYVANDLKLRFVLVPGENLIDLVIDTQRRPDAGVHMGTFRLETGEGVRVTGRIECRAG